VRIVGPDDKVDTKGTRQLTIDEDCTLEIGVGRVDKDIELAKRCK